MLRLRVHSDYVIRASTCTYHFAPITFSRNFSSESDILSWQSLCQWFIIGRPAQPIYNRTYQLRNETMKEKTSECNENKRCWTCHFQMVFALDLTPQQIRLLVKRLGSSWYLESFSHTSAIEKWYGASGESWRIPYSEAMRSGWRQLHSIKLPPHNLPNWWERGPIRCSCM